MSVSYCETARIKKNIAILLIVGIYKYIYTLDS